MVLIPSIYFTAIRLVIRATKKGLNATKTGNIKMQLNTTNVNRPTTAYIGATWCALGVGLASYLIGLWNATIQLNEKGFYFAVFILAMFAAATLQKTVRDREEGLPVTNVFLGMGWAAFFSSIALLVIGLFNAEMLLSEKGFYGISFLLSLFSVVTVQKNIRDMTNEKGETDPEAFPRAQKGLDIAVGAAEITDI